MSDIHNNQVSKLEKIGYSLGDTASNLFFQSFMFFLPIFYTDIFGIPAIATGTLFLITRIWDTINDPIMGMLADRTSSRWGRFRPYLLYGAIPFGIFGVLTFTTPSLTVTGKIIYAYVTYGIMMMIYTLINIPYSALLGVMTSSSIERTRISSYRFVAAFAAGILVQGATLYLVDTFGEDNHSVLFASNEGTEIEITESGLGNTKVIFYANDGKHIVKEEFQVNIYDEGQFPPEIRNPLKDIGLRSDFDTYTINLSKVFLDADNNDLQLTAEYSHKDLIDLDIENKTLIIKNNQSSPYEGTKQVDITIHADDGTGNIISDEFTVTINQDGNTKPIVVNPFVKGFVLEKGFSEHTVDIRKVFRDIDGDKLHFEIYNDKAKNITAEIIGDSAIVIKERKQTAEDGFGSIMNKLFSKSNLQTSKEELTLTAYDSKGGTTNTDIQIYINVPGEYPPILINEIQPIALKKGFGIYKIDASNVFFETSNTPCEYSVSTTNESIGFRTTMGLYGLLAIILFIFTFKITRERIRPLIDNAKKRQDLKDLFKNRPWIVLFITGVFTLSFVSIRNGSIMYYFTYFVGNKYLATGFMITGTIAAILGTLLTGWFSRVMGKTKAFIVLMLITCFLSAYFYFLSPTQILSMFIVQFIINFASAPTTPIIWAMYADTSDYSEWKTGRRATGLIFSAATSSQKLGWTIGGTFTGWFLAIFGYKANAAQSQETIFGLKLMMSWIPFIFSGLAAVTILFYKLNDREMVEIEQDLETNRKLINKK